MKHLTYILALLSMFFALPILAQTGAGRASGIIVDPVPLAEISCSNSQACFEAIDAALGVAGVPGSPIIIEIPNGNIVSTDLSNITVLTASPIFTESGDILSIDPAQPWLTAVELSGAMTPCGPGDAARGINSDGSAFGCFTPSGGSGAWTDGADVVLNTTTKDVIVGTAKINGAQLSIDGEANQVQLAIQANAGQTANPIEVENSGGTVVFSVDPAGAVIASDLPAASLTGEVPASVVGNDHINALTDIGDLCPGSNIIERNSGDSAWACIPTPGGGSGDDVQVQALTFGDGSPTVVHTYDTDTTDPTSTVSNDGAVAFSGALSASNLSGTNTGDNTEATVVISGSTADIRSTGNDFYLDADGNDARGAGEHLVGDNYGRFYAADYLAGSTTDGIQEAIDACPATQGCKVYTRCGTRSISTRINIGDPTLDAAQPIGIHVYGCGGATATASGNGTRLDWSGGDLTATTLSSFFRLTGLGHGIHDMGLTSSSNLNYAIHVTGDQDDLTSQPQTSWHTYSNITAKAFKEYAVYIDDYAGPGNNAQVDNHTFDRITIEDDETALDNTGKGCFKVDDEQTSSNLVTRMTCANWSEKGIQIVNGGLNVTHSDMVNSAGDCLTPASCWAVYVEPNSISKHFFMDQVHTEVGEGNAWNGPGGAVDTASEYSSWTIRDSSVSMKEVADRTLLAWNTHGRLLVEGNQFSGLCVDLWNDVGVPQTSGTPPDGKCDFDGLVFGSKTRTIDIGCDTIGCTGADDSNQLKFGWFNNTLRGERTYTFDYSVDTTDPIIVSSDYDGPFGGDCNGGNCFPKDYDGDGTKWTKCDCGTGTTPGPTVNWICGLYVNHAAGTFVDGKSDDAPGTHPSCRFNGERIWDDAQDDLNVLHNQLVDGDEVHFADGVYVQQGYDRNSGTDPTGLCWNSATRDYTGDCPVQTWSDGSSSTQLGGAVRLFKDGIKYIADSGMDDDAEEDYQRENVWWLDNRGEFEPMNCRGLNLGYGTLNKSETCTGFPPVLHGSHIIRSAKVLEQESSTLDATFPSADFPSYEMCVCNDKDDAACTVTTGWGLSDPAIEATNWNSNASAGSVIRIDAGTEDYDNRISYHFELQEAPTETCGYKDITTSILISGSSGSTHNANDCTGESTHCAQLFTQTAILPAGANSLAGYWMEFTSGVLDGQRYMISTNTTQRMRLNRSLPELPAPSDGIRILGGCTTADDCGIVVKLGLKTIDTGSEVIGTAVPHAYDAFDREALAPTLANVWLMKNQDDYITVNSEVRGITFAPQDWLGSSTNCYLNTLATGPNLHLNPGNDGTSAATACNTSCGPMAADEFGDPGAPTTLTCDTGPLTSISSVQNSGFKDTAYYYGSYDPTHGSNTWIDGHEGSISGYYDGIRVMYHKHGALMDPPGNIRVENSYFAYNTNLKLPVTSSNTLIGTFGAFTTWRNNMFFGNVNRCNSIGACPLFNVGQNHLLDGNHFVSNRGVVLRVPNQADGARIVNNVFQGNRGLDIYFTCNNTDIAHPDVGPCTNIVVQGNRFAAGGYGDGQDNAVTHVLISNTEANGFGVGNLAFIGNTVEVETPNPGIDSSGGYSYEGDPTCVDLYDNINCTTGSPQDEMPQTTGAADGFCDATCVPKMWAGQDCFVGFSDTAGTAGMNDANNVMFEGNMLSGQGKLFCGAQSRDPDKGASGWVDGYPIVGLNKIGSRSIRGIVQPHADFDKISEATTECASNPNFWDWAFVVDDAYNAHDCGEAAGTGTRDNVCRCQSDGTLIDAW